MAAYKPGVSAGVSPGTSPTSSAGRETDPAGTPPGRPRDHQTTQLTLSEWSEGAAQLTSAANDTASKLEPYLASIDNTLKGLGPYLAQANWLGPYLAQVNRILERLEQRPAPVVPQPLMPTVLPASATGIQQGTIIRYLVKKSEDLAIARGTPRESGVQPTPLEEASGATGPDSQPSVVSTPRGHSPETVDWRGALSGCQVDWGAAGEAEEPLTRPTENEQPSGPSVTDNADRYRKSRAQPTPPEETPNANGPNTQPSDVPTPQGDYPERFNW